MPEREAKLSFMSIFTGILAHKWKHIDERLLTCTEKEKG
tara:strand:+ start:394 stop:510 length:117 start_codon:yes stop_codon:yes gene_type:complete